MGTGEAVTSFLEDKGIPGIVERTLVRPPSSQLGPIDPAQRAAFIAASPMGGKYSLTVDRDSAYERLRARAGKAAEAAAEDTAVTGQGGAPEFQNARRYGRDTDAPTRPVSTTRSTGGSSRNDLLGEAFAKSFARQLGTRTGQAVVRGILGSIFGKR